MSFPPSLTANALRFTPFLLATAPLLRPFPGRDSQSAGVRARQEARKKRRAELVDKISTKIQAVFWVGLSGAIIYFTDMPRKLMEDERVNRPFLNVAVACLGVNLCIFIYLTCWLGYQER